MADNYITILDEKGTINISAEVIANIIRTSVVEIDGVGTILNSTGADIAEFVGLKTYLKGIKITNEDDTLSVDIIITVKYGFNIIDVANKVQNSIMAQIQSTLGIDNIKVNIHVSGISFL